MKEKLQSLRRHKLLTKKLLRLFQKNGTQRDSDDPIVITKFFSPYIGVNWYAIEFNEVTGIFFGVINGNSKDWGTWSYEDFQSLTIDETGVPLIERDKWFTPKKLSEIQKLNWRE